MTKFILEHLCLIIIFEIAAVLTLVIAFMHQEKFVLLEDRIKAAVRHGARRLKFRAKAVIFCYARKIFIAIYRPYRRMKARILKRLLCQFGLKAVRAEEQNEILSR